ncbi:hypothetical protein ACQCVK_13775 [Rossellomorea vietnamensis]|uniref:Uncharacterized protein n=1 Tax=Rossellomorea aquimaris TaxID=189382 RepID=A0A5D4THG0_9BACI|nr:hypothetical protein [Rossellomorea aquimaris]TYS75077.1 hypothetical protein FZC80_18030 [Rossellomorea aquimaris]
MVIRKIAVSLLTGTFMIIIFSMLAERLAVGLAIGMYLLPILFIYGIPSSVLSDFTTRRLTGLKRAGASFLVHTSMGLLFVAAPILLTGSKGGIENFLSPFVVLTAIIFWLIDEVIRSHKFRQTLDKTKGVLKKIGELRI